LVIKKYLIDRQEYRLVLENFALKFIVEKNERCAKSICET